MSDDIREVMRTTPFAPKKRIGDPSGRQGGHEGRADSENRDSAHEELSEKEMALLERDVEAANRRLEAAGRAFRLKLAIGDGVAAVRIIYRDSAGAESVTRTIAPEEFALWVERLESGEGLVIDETA